MNKNIAERIFFFVTSLILVAYLPWWMIALLIVVGFVLFVFYAEGVVVALFFDSLYAAAGSGIDNLPDTAYLFTIVSIIGMLGVEFLRGRILRGHVS